MSEAVPVILTQSLLMGSQIVDKRKVICKLNSKEPFYKWWHFRLDTWTYAYVNSAYSVSNCIFVTAIWLSYGQLWAILKETASLTQVLITAFVQVRPEGHREPRNKVGSLSPAECLAGFQPRTFWFWLQRLNPLGHSSI